MKTLKNKVFEAHYNGSFNHYYQFSRLQANENSERLWNMMVNYIHMNRNRDSYKEQDAKINDFMDSFNRGLEKNIFDSLINTTEKDLSPYIIKLLRFKLFVDQSVNDENKFLQYFRDTVPGNESDSGLSLDRILSTSIQSQSDGKLYRIVRRFVRNNDTCLSWDVMGEKKGQKYYYNFSPIVGNLGDRYDTGYHEEIFYLEEYGKQMAFEIRPGNENTIICSQCCWYLFREDFQQRRKHYHFVQGFQKGSTVEIPKSIDHSINLLDIIFQKKNKKKSISELLHIIRANNYFSLSNLSNIEIENQVLSNSE